MQLCHAYATHKSNGNELGILDISLSRTKQCFKQQGCVVRTNIHAPQDREDRKYSDCKSQDRPKAEMAVKRVKSAEPRF